MIKPSDKQIFAVLDTITDDDLIRLYILGCQRTLDDLKDDKDWAEAARTTFEPAQHRAQKIYPVLVLQLRAGVFTDDDLTSILSRPNQVEFNALMN